MLADVMPEPLNILVVEDDLPCATPLPHARMRRPSRDRRGRRPGGAAPARARGLQPGGERSAHAADGRSDAAEGEIRARIPHLPVLLMTAFGDVDKAVAAMRAGACDFLLKPFEPKVLLEQIARYAVPAAGRPASSPPTRARAEPAGAGRARGQDRCHGAAHRRVRHRQGGLRALHPRPVGAAGGPSSPSTARRFPTTCSKPRCSATRRARSPAPRRRRPASSSRPRAAPAARRDLGNAARRCRPSCCACCRSAKSSGSAARSRSPLDIRVLATSNRDMGRRSGGRALPRGPVLPAQRLPAQIPALRERPGDIVPLARHFLAGRRAAIRRQGLPLRRGAAGGPRLAGQCAGTGKRAACVQRALITSWCRPITTS
jgi:hypothetical protein